jgi:CubicO group peptidase (beta-lactamase class C family)
MRFPVLLLFAIVLSLVPADSPCTAQDPTSSDVQRTLFEQAADYSKKFNGHGVLIQHRGKILYERFDDWGKETPHMLASGTKSFSGVLAMFAVQDGLLELDELVCETITEWKEDPQKNKITIRHLLTLSSGLEPADAAFPTRNAALLTRNPVLAQRQNRIARQDLAKGLSKLASGNWFEDSLKVPMKYQPGERFDYGPSHFYVFGELINRKLKAQSKIEAKNFEAYTKLRILDPLGIQVGRWGKDAQGNVNIPGGMMLTARNWAKLGQFVVDKGTIEQKLPGESQETSVRLLKEELLSQCFVPSRVNKSYGLTWWLNGVDSQADSGLGSDRLRQDLLNNEASLKVQHEGEPLKVYMAAGLGKQRLYIIPSFDLVVVRFAEPSPQGARFQNDDFIKPILQALTTSKP